MSKIKMPNSYQDGLNMDGFSTDSSYELGLASGVFAILDNLTGNQCDELWKNIIQNKSYKSIPYHILYKLFEQVVVAKGRGDHTAYTKSRFEKGVE
tara:strand:+ start:741 stop:1028 length:288 start_codon:yes stop_codon:yes gene_type:complete